MLLPIVILNSCAPKKEPAKEHATVVAKHASVRMKNSSTSRTLITLEPNTEVDVLEKQGNWYRVRTSDTQGWMEETTLMTDEMSAKIKAMVETAKKQDPQNTAIIRDDANLRMEPGRNSTVIRKVTAETKVEVLERRTLPRPNTPPPAVDVWIKIRTSPKEVGWILGSVLDYEVPEAIGGFMEGSNYTAIKTIKTVQDSDIGPIKWYVVGERRPGAPSELGFNGIRVFTWNMKKHRYETAIRLKVRGAYPLAVGQDTAGNPTFQFSEMAEDGTITGTKKFYMLGVIVKENKS
jgi:uncharacterized protein YgiM (DUF1202 family)